MADLIKIIVNGESVDVPSVPYGTAKGRFISAPVSSGTTLALDTDAEAAPDNPDVTWDAGQHRFVIGVGGLYMLTYQMTVDAFPAATVGLSFNLATTRTPFGVGMVANLDGNAIIGTTAPYFVGASQAQVIAGCFASADVPYVAIAGDTVSIRVDTDDVVTVSAAVLTVTRIG